MVEMLATQWMTQMASHSVQETEAVVSIPLEQVHAVGTKVGDEEELANQQEVLQDCNCTQATEKRITSGAYMVKVHPKNYNYTQMSR